MTGVDGGYDLDPRRLGIAGVSLVGRVLGINDGTLALADDAEKLLAAADQSYAAFIEAADKLAATPAMRSEVDRTEVPAPLPPLRVDDIRTLNLREENVGAIIWAMGYGFSYDWVKLRDSRCQGRSGPAAWRYRLSRGLFPRTALDAHVPFGHSCVHRPGRFPISPITWITWRFEWAHRWPHRRGGETSISVGIDIRTVEANGSLRPLDANQGWRVPRRG